MVNMQSNPPVEKGSPEYLQAQARNAVTTLGSILGFTLVNLVLLLIDSGRYFLFSASVPYYLTCFGKELDYYAQDHYYTWIGLGISAGILAAYLLCMLLARKRIGRSSGWLIAALCLFLLDTLAMVFVVFFLFEDPMSNILDIIFHGAALWQIFWGIRCNRKLTALNRQQDTSLSRPQVELD